MGKDLIGKYCLKKMTPSNTEFFDEIHTITGLHQTHPKAYVHLDGYNYSVHHINGLLISDEKSKLEKILREQKEYHEDLAKLRLAVHEKKKAYYLKVSKSIKEIEE